ncbi:MAG: phosphate acyltransferase PlsX [Clostridiales bacterium]|nr:phosphate acyltransferase PlsX [Clostridiales bacterium]
MRILVDAMGGDKAPNDIVAGCIDAINVSEGYDILLIGNEAIIEKILREKKFTNPRLKIYNAEEAILNEDQPTKAIKEKKDSSMVVGFRLLKQKQGDVFISAGNTGALMTGSLLLLGRIKGIDRPALAPVIPTKEGGAMIIDAGLNTMCKPVNYQQFAKIGSIYMREMFDVRAPRVGLINVGSEERKGNENIKQAYSRLSGSDINFVGNIEGRHIPDGKVDVAVCDGFVGNVLLKFLEGVGSFIFDGLNRVYSKNLLSKLSALAVRNELRQFKKRLDYEEYGGTPILGVDGTVIKCHGSSNAKTIKNAIIKAYKYAKSSVLEQIRKEFKDFKSLEVGNG